MLVRTSHEKQIPSLRYGMTIRQNFGDETRFSASWVEAEFGQFVLDGVADEPVQKRLGRLMIARAAQRHAALVNGWVRHRNPNEVAGLAILWAAGEGQRDEGGLRVAGERELCRLRDVFADDQLGCELGLEVQRLDRGGRGHAVGGVAIVCDGDAGNARARQRAERERLGGGVAARPDDQHAVGVHRRLRVNGELGVDQRLRVGAIGGEEQVCRRAVLDLFRQGRGGAERGYYLHAGLGLVLPCEFGQNGFEIRGGGDVELVGTRWRLGDGACAEGGKPAKQEGERPDDSGATVV